MKNYTLLYSLSFIRQMPTGTWYANTLDPCYNMIPLPEPVLIIARTRLC